jgi:hypothetical protein
VGAAVSARYRYWRDRLPFTGFLNQHSGQWTPLEMNPRFQEADQRYRSLLVVLTPSRLHYFVSGVRHTIVNGSPIRFVWSADPYVEEASLDRNPVTRLPLSDAGDLPLPWRALALIHWNPQFSTRDPVEDLRVRGGDLRRDLSTAEISARSPEIRSWDVLTSGHSYQLNSTLAVFLPGSLKNKYGESEVRRRLTESLPASVFYDIIWYEAPNG